MASLSLSPLSSSVLPHTCGAPTLSLLVRSPLSSSTHLRRSPFFSVHVSTLQRLPRGRTRFSDPSSTSPRCSFIPATWQTLESHVESLSERHVAPDSSPKSDVTLFRDTNAWCPFCQRVWLALEEKYIPYSTELVNLSNKPKWFLDIVPTGLVPAIKIGDSVTYESLDILFRLEEAFPENPLIPLGKKGEIEDLFKLLSELSSNMAVFKLIGNTDPEKEEELTSATLAVLDGFEEAFKKYSHEGPFLLGSELTLADCAFINPLEGTNYRLAYLKNISVRGNPRFPLISRWFHALDLRPSYQKVKMDSRSANLVLNVFRERQIKAGNVNPSFPAIPFSHNGFPSSGFIDTENGAFLAASKLVSNHKTIIDFCLKSKKVQNVLKLKTANSNNSKNISNKIVSNNDSNGSNDSSNEIFLEPSEEDREIVSLTIRLFAMALLAEAQEEQNVDGDLSDFPAFGREDLVNSVEGFDVLDVSTVSIAVQALEHLVEIISVPRDMKIGAKEKFVEVGYALINILSQKIPKEEVVFA